MLYNNDSINYLMILECCTIYIVSLFWVNMTNVGEGGTHFKLTPSSSISKTLIADVKYGEKKLPKDLDTNKQKLSQIESNLGTKRGKDVQNMGERER